MYHTFTYQCTWYTFHLEAQLRNMLNNLRLYYFIQQNFPCLLLYISLSKSLPLMCHTFTLYIFLVDRFSGNAGLPKCVFPCMPECLKGLQSWLCFKRLVHYVYATCLWNTSEFCTTALAFVLIYMECCSFTLYTHVFLHMAHHTLCLLH